jgi:hypothetical protein
MEGMNLSTPIGEKLVSAGKAAQDQRDEIRRTASFDDVMVSRHLPACADNSQKRPDLLGRKRANCVEFFNDDVISLRADSSGGVISNPELPELPLRH